MPNNDIEVFEHLTADKETALEIDFLTYAIFAYKKSEWIKHFQKHTENRLPNREEIDNWISQLTDYDFDRMRDEAAEFFHASAEDHLEEYIENQKKEAVDSSILSEVRSTMTRVKYFTSPWKHLGIALLMAVIAPVLLGGVLFLLGIFDKSFPVHVTIAPTEQASSKAPQGEPSDSQ